MPIVYERGDIFRNQVSLTVIAHQCNTQGSFGAGIAFQIKRMFPEVDIAQRQWYREEKQQLGDIQLIPVKSRRLVIANLYAQSSVARIPGRRNTNYQALEACLRKLKEQLTDRDRLGMPKIGAGLGGGDWEEIESIIERVFHDRTVYVYVL